MSGFLDEFLGGFIGILGAIGGGIVAGISAAANAAHEAHEEHLRRQEEERQRILAAAKEETHAEVGRRIRICSDNIKDTNEAGRLALNTAFRPAQAAVRANSQVKHSKIVSVDLTPAENMLTEAERAMKAAESYNDNKAAELSAFERKVDGIENLKELRKYCAGIPEVNEAQCARLTEENERQKENMLTLSGTMQALSELHGKLSAIDGALKDGAEYLNLMRKLNSVIAGINAVNRGQVVAAVAFAASCEKELKALRYSEITADTFREINTLLDRFTATLKSVPEAAPDTEEKLFVKQYAQRLTEAKAALKRIKAEPYFDRSLKAAQVVAGRERELRDARGRTATRNALAEMDGLCASLLRFEKEQAAISAKYAEYSALAEEYVSHCAEKELPLGASPAVYKSRLLKSFDESNPDRSIDRIRQDYEESQRAVRRVRREENLVIHKRLAELEGWTVLAEEGSLESVKRVIFCKKGEPRALRIMDIYASGKVAHKAVGIRVSGIVPDTIESEPEEVISVCKKIAEDSERSLQSLVSACPSDSVSTLRAKAPEHSVENIYGQGYYFFNESNAEMFERFTDLTAEAPVISDETKAVTAPPSNKVKWWNKNNGSMSRNPKAKQLERPL